MRHLRRFRGISLCLLAVAAVLVVLGSLDAELVLPDFTSRQVVDFNDYDGSGAVPQGPPPTPVVPGPLDSGIFAVAGMSDGNLPFGSTVLSGDYARGISAGGIATGGMYAFQDSIGDRALGFQPTEDDMTPGVLLARISNGTGAPIDSLEVSYEVVVFNDQDRANSLSFSWSLAEAGPFTAVAGLDLTTQEVADQIPAFTRTRRSALLYPLDLADGGRIYLRWQIDDVSGAGARDEIGIDNLVVRGTQMLFHDGLESGDMTFWSAHVP